jgi:signal peptidase II
MNNPRKKITKKSEEKNNKSNTHPKKQFKAKDVATKGYYPIIIFLALIMIDRITKIWAATGAHNKDYGIVAITYVTNTGAGFSILRDMNILLAIISIIVLGAIIHFKKQIPKFTVMLISVGIVGNLIDRLAYGSVIDFINFKIWPIFNVADSLICIGATYWIIVMLIELKNSKKIHQN